MSKLCAYCNEECYKYNGQWFVKETKELHSDQCIEDDPITDEEDCKRRSEMYEEEQRQKLLCPELYHLSNDIDLMDDQRVGYYLKARGSNKAFMSFGEWCKTLPPSSKIRSEILDSEVFNVPFDD